MMFANQKCTETNTAESFAMEFGTKWQISCFSTMFLWHCFKLSPKWPGFQGAQDHGGTEMCELWWFEPELDSWSPKGSKLPPDGLNCVMHSTAIHTVESKALEQDPKHLLWMQIGPKRSKRVQTVPSWSNVFHWFFQCAQFPNIFLSLWFCPTFGTV